MEKLPKVLYHGAEDAKTILVPDYLVDETRVVATSTDRDLAILKGFKRALQKRHCVISFTKTPTTLLIVLSPHSPLLSRSDLRVLKMHLHTLPFTLGDWSQSKDHSSCWFSERSHHLFLDTRELQLAHVYRGLRFAIKHPRVGEVEGVF